jgi:hypothetical protein
MNRAAVMLGVLFLLVGASGLAQDAPSTASQDQSSASNDSEAVAVLNQALAAGGASGSSTQDFSVSGSITYYWAGKEVKGSVLVRGRGTDQFRLDAVLPDGTRSWAVSRGKGSVKEADGKNTAIHYFNALNGGALTNPLARIAALLKEGGVQISYLERSLLRPGATV